MVQSCYTTSSFLTNIFLQVSVLYLMIRVMFFVPQSCFASSTSQASLLLPKRVYVGPTLHLTKFDRRAYYSIGMLEGRSSCPVTLMPWATAFQNLTAVPQASFGRDFSSDGCAKPDRAQHHTMWWFVWCAGESSKETKHHTCGV
jgi:hypothetical protein